jgi:DNA-binding MarR family transcriptional regulator
MNKLAVLSIGDTRDVYEAIRTEPGASLSELAETVGSSPSAVHKIVDRLLDADLVEKERDGRSVALHACD